MAIIDALRGAKIALPSPSTIERAGIAGRARARKRSHEALLAGLDPAQVTQLDGLVTVDLATRTVSNGGDWTGWNCGTGVCTSARSGPRPRPRPTRSRIGSTP